MKKYIVDWNPVGFIIWTLMCIGMITGNINPIFGIIICILMVVRPLFTIKIKNRKEKGR